MNSRLRIPPTWLALIFCALGAALAQDNFPTDRDSGEAKEIVEKFRAIAAEQPERAPEVDAYLFPLTREVAETPSEPETRPDPASVEKKTMFFLRGPGGLSAVRAEAFEKDGDVLIITTESGSKAIVQAASVAGELPWYSNDDLESGAVDLEELAASYDGIAARAPTLKKFLETEARRFRAIVEKRENASRDAEESLREKVDRVTSPEFDASANPSSAELARLLAEAEVVVLEHPETAPEIDAWAAPFREHLGHLLVGDEWIDGKWVTAAERREREERERTAKIREGIAYSVEAQIAPDSVLHDVLKEPVWIAGGLFLLALAALVVLRNPVVRIVATATLAAVPLGLALLFYLASRDAAEMPAVPPSASDETIVNLIVAANGGTPMPAVVKQDDLNVFLARRFRIAGASEGGLSRQAQAVELAPGRVAVFELARGWGFDWIVRCDFVWLVENGAPSLEPTKVWIGRLPCPPALAETVARNIEAEYGAALAQTGLAKVFTPAAPEDGQVALSPVASPDSAGGEDSL